MKEPTTKCPPMHFCIKPHVVYQCHFRWFPNGDDLFNWLFFNRRQKQCKSDSSFHSLDTLPSVYDCHGHSKRQLSVKSGQLLPTVTEKLAHVKNCTFRFKSGGSTLSVSIHTHTTPVSCWKEFYSHHMFQDHVKITFKVPKSF